MLSAQGLSTTVADARFSRPLDGELVERLAKEHEVLITIEEGAKGGFGSFVLEHLANAGALDTGLKIRIMTLPDVFQDQDSPFAMYETAGLNARHIAARAIEALGRGDISAIESAARA
jgi:1-deoxy-D-xylulose-5-phosphate synthase